MKKKTTEDFKRDINQLYPSKYDIIGEYIGRSKRVLVKYNECGHTYNAVADKIYKGRNCPICCGGVKLTQEDFEKSVAEMNPHLEVVGEYVNLKGHIEVRCKLCGNTSYPLAEQLKRTKMTGCPVCSSKVVVKGYNDIWTTNPKIASLLLNQEDGYCVTEHSNHRKDFKCPCCHKILNRKVNTVVTNGLCCEYCGKRVSYPEKFLVSFLNQLNEKYKTQKQFDWSKNIKVQNPILCGSKIYDFYIKDKNIIIETHGKQHYVENSFTFENGKSLNDEQENDALKKNLAIKNGVEHYISLDCRESNTEWIKNSILNSELNDMYDLSVIDWNKCNEYAFSSNILKASEYWNVGKGTKEISLLMHVAQATIITYLKTGSELDLCNYTTKESRKRVYKQNIIQ